MHDNKEKSFILIIRGGRGGALSLSVIFFIFALSNGCPIVVAITRAIVATKKVTTIATTIDIIVSTHINKQQ
jgi:hypothetical protein